MNRKQLKIYNHTPDPKRKKNVIPLSSIKAKGDKCAEILIYDDIGDSYYGGLTAKNFAEQLSSLGKIDQINVRINSPGGNVFDGVAIYNTLIKHGAKVNVEIEGMALSIASVIAMAGDTIDMSDNAMIMIHDPWGVVMGNADQLREQATLMDTIKSNLINTYATKTSMENDKISNLMSRETWMTADEALAFGFIDSISSAKSEQMAAHVDMKRFKNAPTDFMKVVEDSAKPNYNNHKYSMARLNKVAMQQNLSRAR